VRRPWGAALTALAGVAATALLAALAGLLAQPAPSRAQPAPSRASGSGAAPAMPPIRHVFVIVLENESESTTFAPDSKAPYLARTLRSQGAFLENYYATGHVSNDNYIAMTSGQPPNAENQSDCQYFEDFPTTATGPYGAQEGVGCVYPADIQNIATQLDAAGLTWRDYDQDMGADPSREAAVCAHPGIDQRDNTQSATAGDEYATRHNPFVYYHSIIDDTALCDSHVVNLDYLPHDLASAAETPSYSYIVPDLCDDGHDSPCANGQPGGLTSANQFLEKWVPMITSSPAFRQQNGLLIITFDEASTSDPSSCCGEIPGPGSPKPGITGPGGGKVGAVLLSPCIAPGTVSTQAYNHYAMLRSVEDIFGLAHLGYAQLPGERSFGSDVFTRRCTPSRAPPPSVRLRAPPIASTASNTPHRVPVSWSSPARGARFELQLRRTSGRRPGGWRTLLRAGSRHAERLSLAAGQTYLIRVRASSGAGSPGRWSAAVIVVPSGARAPGARLRGRWRYAGVRDAWESHALIGSRAGSSYRLRYRGGRLEIIASRWPQGGRAIVSFDGRRTGIDLRSAPPHARQLVYRSPPVRDGWHTLVITVRSGVVPVEGLAIADRR
jgi:hypothetical protein